MEYLLLLLLSVGIFILCRELICWYWKINQQVENQQEIIRLLKKIAGEPIDQSRLIN